MKCPSCDGTGECSNHEERYIDVDRTLPCENCGDVTAVCPDCLGTGDIADEYLTLNPLDPRD